MSQGRHGIKILGLTLLAALSLMAVSVAAAQAGEFRLSNKTFTADTTSTESVLGSGGEGELLTVGGLKITCSSSNASGTVLLGGTAHATVNFAGCKVLNNANCVVYPTSTDAAAKTNKEKLIASGLGSIIAHGTERYLLIDSGAGTFSTVYLESGAFSCLLPLTNIIQGKEAFFLSTASSELLTQTLKTLTATQRALLNGAGAGQLSLGIQLKYGNENADLEEPDKPNAGANTVKVHLANDAIWGAE